MAQDFRDSLLIVLVLTTSAVVGAFSWTAGNYGAALAVIGTVALLLTLALVRPRYPIVTWVGVYVAAVVVGYLGLRYALDGLNQAFA
jgi:hypothetical protein